MNIFGNMKNKAEFARTCFKSNSNCAQSVISAFVDDLKLPGETMMQLASGFGAGMGGMQKTCGAVTGAFMVLGLHNGSLYPDNHSRKEKTAEMIRDFSQRFSGKHGSLECRSLLNIDISTEPGYQYATDNKLFEKVCEHCVTHAVSIIEELIHQSRNR